MCQHSAFWALEPQSEERIIYTARYDQQQQKRSHNTEMHRAKYLLVMVLEKKVLWLEQSDKEQMPKLNKAQ